MTVRIVEERQFDPPRLVVVEQDGRWWPGRQLAWLLLNDGRGWLAEVTWTTQEEWGPGRHIGQVPAARVQLRDGEARRQGV